MLRTIVILTALTLLVGAAGLAEAKREDKGREMAEELREAKADARAERRAEREGAAEPAPAAPPAAPPAADAPAPASGGAIAHTVAAAPSSSASSLSGPGLDPARPVETSFGAAPSIESAFSPLPPSAPVPAPVVFAAGGMAAPRAPGWTPAALDAGEDGAAPWWNALVWAIPVLGVGGIGAVVLLRRKPAARAPSSRMVPVAPGDLEGILRNGQGAVARGALDEALVWFDQAIRIAPSLAVAHFCRGVCLAAKGRVAEAAGALDLAVRHAPDDASYRVHFARAAAALGRTKEAMDALEVVARAMPELGPAMLEDPQLAGLRDHPRFLMMCGAL